MPITGQPSTALRRTSTCPPPPHRHWSHIPLTGAAYLIPLHYFPFPLSFTSLESIHMIKKRTKISPSFFRVRPTVERFLSLSKSLNEGLLTNPRWLEGAPEAQASLSQKLVCERLGRRG